VSLPALPIDSRLPDALRILRDRGALVLVAEPGAGKTTRLPRALLDSGLLEDGECWVLEPRRLAARLAANRVAQELGEPLGHQVGYAVRFEQKVSRATRIRFVTEGLFLRRVQEDPRLEGVGVVLLDEFHERHVETDLALALVARLRRGPRPGLRVGVLSATLDPDPVAAFLDAEVLRCPGRAWPVEVRHAPRPATAPLEAQVAEAVEGLYREGLRGHTLVFLPGAPEIRRCLTACEGAAQRFGLRLLPLHGSLALEAQEAALAPSEAPKVILSTNVAESSVTLEGIQAVVDSGLGREAFHSPWSGLGGLRTARISQARCIQRAGRAGRTGPGLCLRLLTQAEWEQRPAFDAPELLRADLAGPLLSLAGLGLTLEDLAWLDAPPAPALAQARSLLGALGALDPQGRITPLGRRLASLPLHPRLARLVTAGEDLGVPNLARLGAVLLESGDLERRTSLAPRGGESRHALESDLLGRVDQFTGGAGVDRAALAQARKAFHALGGGPLEGDEPALLKALLAAYPDRVAKAGGALTCSLAQGGGARLGPRCRVRGAAWILALEAETQDGQVLIQAASRIEPDWLLDAFPEAIRETEDLVFNAGAGRVDLHSGLWFQELPLLESRRPAPSGHPGAAERLAEAAAALAPPALERLAARVAFLRTVRPDLGLPAEEALRRAVLTEACAGCATLREVEAADWKGAARRALGQDAANRLDTWAPEHLQLPHRRVEVHYDGGQPWIESRLQDFLGLKEGPRVAGGAVPLVLHLLAPNHRAVQVTTDLAGFWQRAYRDLRPQLSRRYPRHAWPEDPA
jgi:ATP-dependent helicase HrpB